MHSVFLLFRANGGLFETLARGRWERYYFRRAESRVYRERRAFV